MTEVYSITVSCDHGDRRPRVARARYYADGLWDVTPQRARDAKGPTGVADPPRTPRPSQLPPRQKGMYAASGDARHPNAGHGDDETRQFITCTLCGMRPLVRWPNLVRVLDDLRHAGYHSLTLQELVLKL